ncbi:unnamed protein product [Mytilus coruscus]|uniref:Uncharacterized protein n=1 Tax=Mytilus coruscus TaxID=42192 RepID=A0A6J8CCV4_MYTCO|nr:unnamed protein product [Mytilus coruscus]
MSDELHSAKDIFNKDSESETTHEFAELKKNHEDVDDMNHTTEIESLLEQNKEKKDSHSNRTRSIPNQPTDDGIIEKLNDSKYLPEHGSSGGSDETTTNQEHPNVKSMVKTINEGSTKTPEPAKHNKIPLPAIESNIRPSPMSEKWKLMNPGLKYFIYIIVLVGLLGATAYITNAIVSKPEVCNGNHYTGPQNDPFFQAAFPKKESSVNMKCFLPFKGNYTVKTFFENGSKGSNVTKICSEVHKPLQYTLYCNRDDVTNCETAECSEECSKFNISLSEMHVILLQLDTSCLSLHGIIEIWNSTIK